MRPSTPDSGIFCTSLSGGCCACRTPQDKATASGKAIPRKAIGTGPFLLVQECQRLELSNLEWFAAADVGAGEFVVAPDHVGLRFCEARPVALVGAARQLRTLAPDHPGHLVFCRLAALGAGQRMGTHLSCFVEKIPFFHN